MSAQRRDVMRLDFGKFSKVERTPQGGLRIPANLTRTGVFPYRQPDGTVRRELRTPDEVFKEDSLRTLRSAPVTDLHPKEMLRPRNWRELAVGHVGEDVKRDGEFVASDLMIQDENAIRLVESGDRKELSCAYTCRLDMTPGTTDAGERYDAIQRHIRYNHVAIGPGGWGRAGSDVALRLDAGDAVQVTPAETPPSTTQREIPKMMIKIDGVDYEAGSTQHIQAEQNRFDRMSVENSTLTGERDEIQGKHDALEGKHDELKTKVDSAADPAALDKLVADRVALHTDARGVLGEDANFTGKSDRDVMIDVIKHDAEDFDPKDRSDDYIRGRFDMATTSTKRHDAGGSGIGAARSAAVGARKPAPNVRKDGKPAGDESPDRFDARAAQQRMQDNNAEAASVPLRYHRST